MRIFNILYHFLALIIACLMLISCCSDPQVTEFNDINDYGIIKGTGTVFSDYNAKRDFFLHLFPQNIDPSFEDVKYHYKAIDNGALAFEASLEFKIPDSEQFSAYVSSIAEPELFTVFPYDEKYFEYLPRVNYLTIFEPDSNEWKACYRVEYANIERVLIDPAEQKVLYFLLVIRDDYRTTTADLCEFYQRFDIDPKEFAERYPQQWYDAPTGNTE